jgi:hypothetical protein
MIPAIERLRGECERLRVENKRLRALLQGTTDYIMCYADPEKIGVDSEDVRLAVAALRGEGE